MEIGEIRNTARRGEDGWISAFEASVERYFYEYGASSIPALFTLFSEELPDELKFTVIHCAEQAAPESYVAGVVAYLQKHEDFSVDWADIVHFRVMNGPVHFAEYLRVLKQCPLAFRLRMLAYIRRLKSDARNERFSSRLAAMEQVLG